MLLVSAALAMPAAGLVADAPQMTPDALKMRMDLAEEQNHSTDLVGRALPVKTPSRQGIGRTPHIRISGRPGTGISRLVYIGCRIWLPVIVQLSAAIGASE